MSQKNTMQVTIPAGWNETAQIHWVKNERHEAIHAIINDLNTYDTDKKPEAKVLQLTYYLYLIGDYAAAATVLEPLMKTTQNPEVLLNLAVCYRRTGRYQDAVNTAHKTLELRPKDVVAYDVLSTSFFELGQLGKASWAGTQSLKLKDERAQPADKKWQLPKMPPQTFARQANKKNVIAFSLWGDNPRYLRGAIRNLLLAQDMYPNWTLRFYLDNSVPQEFIELAQKLGAQIVLQPANRPIKEKLCWRFLVANDATVGYFLVRDIDSVFSVREVNAVAQWMQSDKYFHLIRDWWSHTDLILAGMWGGVANVLPDLFKMLASYTPNTMETPNIDQWFLRDRVWAYVRSSLYTHDRCFDMPNTTRLAVPDYDQHIGQNEAVVQNQAVILDAWIQRYACLQTKK